MACSCTKKASREFVWTSDDGSESQTYDTEIQAKAKKIRKGGTYISQPKA